MASEFEIKRLLRKLEYNIPYVRFNAANALAEIGEAALTPLIDLLRENQDEQTRAAAAYALGQMRDPQAIPALIEALELGAADEPTSVAEHACYALERIGGGEAIHAAQFWRALHERH